MLVAETAAGARGVWSRCDLAPSHMPTIKQLFFTVASPDTLVQ